MVSFTSKTTLIAIVASYLSISVAAQGTQFITGTCSSDADCASACCGFNTGKCAGPVIAQDRDGGCGFGDATPNRVAADAFLGTTPQNNGGNNQQAPPAGNPPAGGQGSQFITGECSSDADCASDCCGFNSGKCAGPVIAQTRDGGCGFGDGTPNSRAADALQARAAELVTRMYQ